MEREVDIPCGKIITKGILSIPEPVHGLILFAHGSGSGRLSPRNTFVAKVLQKAGFATLLIDLLTSEEERDRSKVFDIDLLTERLQGAFAWAENEPMIRWLPIGYFGASTGAAAALKAAARSDLKIKAVVSRGGRPDLAMEDLPKVKSPTLLIIGGEDGPVIGMNEEAFEQIRSQKRLVIVPGASHLFEEPGALEEVARLATGWFEEYLTKLN
ncbi:MAG: alpha/beta hydrolase [Deltaproteobacteria bacterium]|nr:alpha/beta hydrolase [Deltaproteobacteria bacterium]